MDDEIDLLDYIRVVWKWKWLIVTIIAFTITVAYYVTSKEKPVYESRISFIVKTNDAGGSSQLASMMGGGFAALLNRTPSLASDIQDIIVSSIIANKVVDKLVLLKLWQSPNDLESLSMNGAIEKLKGEVSIDQSKYSSRVIVLKVEDEIPIVARDIANAYVEEIQDFYAQISLKDSVDKRDLMEKQLLVVEQNLREIESKYQKFTSLLPSGVSIIGTKSIEGIRLARELEIQNNLYILLKKELESAKLEITKNSNMLMVLDKPEVAKEPVKQKRRLILLSAFMVSLMLSIFIAFVCEYISSLNSRR